MARSPYTQLDYSGIATVQTMTNSGGISAGSGTFNISSSATWLNSSGYYLGNGPTNTPGSAPFVVAIDYNTANEEKVLCSSVTSGGLVTVLQRGYDGTTAVAHNSTVINCVPVFSATEAREANAAVSNTVGQVTAAGDILIGTGANAMNKLAIGAQGTNLSTNGTTASWQPGFPYTMGAQGGVLYTNGTNPGWTAAGTSGQVLTSAGTGTPTWTSVKNIGYYSTLASYTATNTATTIITTASLPFTSILVNLSFICTGSGSGGNVNISYTGTGVTNGTQISRGTAVAGYCYSDTRIIGITSGNVLNLQLANPGTNIFNNFQLTVLGIS
jgi:hypothetical protein